MSDTPTFDRTVARHCLGMSDDTLAFLADKMNADTYTIRKPGGDLSLTDKKGLLSYLEQLKERETANDVAGPVVDRTRPARRRGSVRHDGPVDNVRDSGTAA